MPGVTLSDKTWRVLDASAQLRNVFYIRTYVILRKPFMNVYKLFYPMETFSEYMNYGNFMQICCSMDLLLEQDGITSSAQQDAVSAVCFVHFVV